MPYSNFPRGSEWRRWDLHIHTPDTKKNDNYSGKNSQEKWEKFIEDVNCSPDDISVVGITDYFCTENYFKFKQLIAEGRITKHFDLVIPNIELRVTPVTGTDTPINIHCIFNPEIEKEIDSRFLSQIKMEFGQSKFSARKDEIIRLGKALPGPVLEDEEAYKKGINQFVISMSDLIQVFKDDPDLKKNTIIVVSNKSSDGASGLNHSDYFEDKQSQLNATRWNIYQFSDAIFSSNENDVMYFTGLGVDSTEVVLEKCHKLMPCFHGCDAHGNSQIFKPYGSRYCWIKADPTFEGLKQTLYEPKDRVKIQSLRPDIKSERHLISEIRFLEEDNVFGKRIILLSENLTAIIGGKSSGKSLLLYTTAKSIDPKQVDQTSERLGFEGYNLKKDFKFEVVWKNGDINKFGQTEDTTRNHKITYIPQLYINHLVEKNNKQELNDLIHNIVLQDSEFKESYENKLAQIAEFTVEIESSLNTYLQTREKLVRSSETGGNLGNSKAIAQSIISLEKSIAEGQKVSNFTETEIGQYAGILEKKDKAETRYRSLLKKEALLDSIQSAIQKSVDELIGPGEREDSFYGKSIIDKVLNESDEKFDDLAPLVDSIKLDFNQVIKRLQANILNLKVELEKTGIVEEIETHRKTLIPFQKKLEGQNDLQTLISKLEREKVLKEQAVNNERQYQALLIEYKDIRESITKLLKNRYELYKSIAKEINEKKQNIGEGILLNCDLVYKQLNLALFEQVNKAAISRDNIFYSLFTDTKVNYDGLINFFSNNPRVRSEKLIIENNIPEIPLRQRVSIEDILRGLIADCFEFDYTVSYKGDNLLTMSPGKKGTVLLILFLHISSAEHPILIDQPEDNLDNRTIYELLCQMIIQKKKHRQIVIVSHNANLVVSTDAENIIVANQGGQDEELKHGQNRFEYINGSIEHSFSKEKAETDLQKQGIKEHVCDILEGGDKAFKLRELKYAL